VFYIYLFHRQRNNFYYNNDYFSWIQPLTTKLFRLEASLDDVHAMSFSIQVNTSSHPNNEPNNTFTKAAFYPLFYILMMIKPHIKDPPSPLRWDGYLRARSRTKIPYERRNTGVPGLFNTGTWAHFQADPSQQLGEE
jgi:hypothetical protein